MSRSTTWVIGIVITLLLVGSVAYPNRETIVLKMPGFTMKQLRPVGPFQDITWSTGTAVVAKPGINTHQYRQGFVATRYPRR